MSLFQDWMLKEGKKILDLSKSIEKEININISHLGSKYIFSIPKEIAETVDLNTKESLSVKIKAYFFNGDKKSEINLSFK